MTHFYDVVGYAAGFLTTAAFVPQVVKTFKERSARDISLGMYVLFCIGVGMWLFYGLLIASWPVVGSNLVTLLLSSAVLILKLRHGFP
jgi:MtN3 and saliva related transmembrane protein